MRVLDEIARDGRGTRTAARRRRGGRAAAGPRHGGAARRRILEIGTAIGYSGIWLAGALPAGGMLLTMEMDAERAHEARANFERAGVCRSRQRHRRRRAADARESRGPIRLDLPGRRQGAVQPLLDRLVSLLAAGRSARDRQRVVGRRGRAGIHPRPAARTKDTRAIAEL